MDQPWTEDSVARTLTNPSYSLTDRPIVIEEKWIKANARLVQETGAESLSGHNPERPSGW
jgi:hypothetical protein